MIDAFGDLPLARYDDRRCRGEFKAWRAGWGSTSRRQADYAWVVLARVLSWGKEAGGRCRNPCEQGGRLYHGSRAEKGMDGEADEAAFLDRAPRISICLW